MVNLPHQLETDTQMIPKVEIVQHVNDVVRSIGVLFAQLIENANLDECLMVEAFLVANDFDCDVLTRFMVKSTNHLSKASLSNHFQNFIAIANVIMNNLGGIDGEKNLINFWVYCSILMFMFC